MPLLPFAESPGLLASMTSTIPAHVYEVLRWATIVLEVLGTLLIWLDTVRLNARNPPHGFMIGDAPGYGAW